MEGPLLMLIEHKGTALMHLTFRGPCFHHKVKGKWYLKIPLDAVLREDWGGGFECVCEHTSKYPFQTLEQRYKWNLFLQSPVHKPLPWPNVAQIFPDRKEAASTIKQKNPTFRSSVSLPIGVYGLHFADRTAPKNRRRTFPMLQI